MDIKKNKPSKEMNYFSSQPSLVDEIKKGEKEEINDMPIYNSNEEW